MNYTLIAVGAVVFAIGFPLLLYSMEQKKKIMNSKNWKYLSEPPASLLGGNEKESR